MGEEKGEKMIEEGKEIGPEEELQMVPGIGPVTSARLVEAGYTTIEALAGASPEELEPILGDRAGGLIAAAKEGIAPLERMEEVAEEAAEMAEVTEEIGVPGIAEAVVDKEQGPFLDLIDKFTDKDTTLHIDVEDVGGRLFGRSLRILGRVSIDLGTLKKPKEKE